MKIALFLGVITAAEVGTYFWEDLFGTQPTTTALILTLFPMMIAKFAIVCGYFMHLKYDNPIFRRVFVFGLVLAIVVYAIFVLRDGVPGATTTSSSCRSAERVLGR